MKYIDDHFSQEYIDYFKKLKNPNKLISSGILSQCSNNDATDPFAGNSAEIVQKYPSVLLLLPKGGINYDES